MNYFMIETWFSSDIAFPRDANNTWPPLTVSAAEQRPQLVRGLRVRPARVCDHYLSHWQVFFVRKESSVIGPKKQGQQNP